MCNIIAFAAEVHVLERKSKKSIYPCLFFFFASWKYDDFPVGLVFLVSSIFFNNAVPVYSLLLFEKNLKRKQTFNSYRDLIHYMPHVGRQDTNG